MRKYGYTFSARLTDEDREMLKRLLERFGKVTWAKQSVNFREFIHRMTEAFPFETRWDNPGAYYDEESSEETTEEPT